MRLHIPCKANKLNKSWPSMSLVTVYQYNQIKIVQLDSFIIKCAKISFVQGLQKNDFNHKNNVVASRNFSPKNAEKNCGKVVRVHRVQTRFYYIA